MAEKSKFKTQLLEALKHFDLSRAEQLDEQIQEAELAGYVLTKVEERLLQRLISCIDSYKRCMASITY